MTDEQLAEEALAAGSPDDPLPDGAVSLWSVEPTDGRLPGWYMPPASGRLRVHGWRRVLVVAAVVVALVAIVASGLCNTYGELIPS